MIINIPLSKAYELLEKAEAFIKGGDFIHPELSELTGEGDNYFLYFDDGCATFFYENNSSPQIDTLTNQLILTDDDGKEVRLTLLTTMKL